MAFGTPSRRYQVQEQALSYDPKLIILNDEGHCEFIVKSTLLALGDKLSLFDTYGKELYKIRQQFAVFFFTFKLYTIDDTEVASAECRRTPWSYKLEVISPIFGDYQMHWQSGILSQEFILTKNNRTIARINHKRTLFTQTYSVEIVDDVTNGEIPFVLSLVIVLWCTQRYRRQNFQINS